MKEIVKVETVDFVLRDPEWEEPEISLIPIRHRELTAIPSQRRCDAAAAIPAPKKRVKIDAAVIYEVLVGLSLYALPFLLMLAGWLLKLIGVTE